MRDEEEFGSLDPFTECHLSFRQETGFTEKVKCAVAVIKQYIHAGTDIASLSEIAI